MDQLAHILVLEDEWIVARGIQRTLETAGYHVERVAGSSKEVLDNVTENPPDLALLEVALSDGVDGIQLASELQSRVGVPIIFVTAHADAPTLRRAAQIGPAGYVVKPFQEAQLLSAVAIALPLVGGSPVTEGAVPKGLRHDTLDVDGRQDRLRRVATAVSGWVPSPGRATDLTLRELDVVHLLLSNGRVSSIATQLEISPHTVRHHLRSIFRKLGVHSQVELIRALTTDPTRRRDPRRGLLPRQEPQLGAERPARFRGLRSANPGVIHEGERH